MGRPATLSDALDAILERCFEAWGASHYRSHGGDDDPENLISLCAWHHQRALHHDRVIRVIGCARTRFEFGVRRGRAPLAVYTTGDALLSA